MCRLKEFSIQRLCVVIKEESQTESRLATISLYLSFRILLLLTVFVSFHR